MVKTLNSKIEKGKTEFEKGNFEEALNYFKQVESDDYHYELALMFMSSCLMEIEEYGEALNVSNQLIEMDAYNKFAWFNKALCQIFLKDSRAFRTVENVVKVIDPMDKYDLVYVAKLYKLLNEYNKALIYCDSALKIDENFKDALYEKFLIAIMIDDDELMEEVSEKIFYASDDLTGFMPLMIIRLFSKDYIGCKKLIEEANTKKFDKEHLDIIKSVIYKQISEDFNANLLLVNGEDISLDNALEALFDFVETGKNQGKIDGTKYYII